MPATGHNSPPAAVIQWGTPPAPHDPCPVADPVADTQARPTTAADAAAAVAAARAAGHAVYPTGGGTQPATDFRRPRPGVTLDTAGLDRVIDYPARDLTVTVGAGLTVARLAELLAAEGQRLPVDIPTAAAATVGGSVAADVSGPRRLGSGTLRDYLIGVTFTTDAGELAKAGGRVVKNVAGYDLMKLHTGARGTLGVLTELTFKVTPTPEARALVAVAAPAAAVADLLDRLHASRTRPGLVELWNAVFARVVSRHAGVELPAGDFLILVGYEEKQTAVDWQVRTLTDELAGTAAGNRATFAGAAGSNLWAALPELPTLAGLPFTTRLSTLPSRLAALVTGPPVGPDCLIHAHALTGVATVHSATPVTLGVDPPRAGAG